MTDTTSSPPRPRADRSLGWRLERVYAPWITVGVGLLAGVGALAAGPEPTGYAVVDAVLVLGTSMVLVAAFARARRWAWLTTSGMLAVTAGGALALAAALAAVAIGVVSAGSVRQRRKVVGAVVGALAVQVLFRQRQLVFQGGDVLWGVAACVPVLVSGYANARRRARRVVRWSVVGLAGFVVLAGGLYAVVAIGARSDLDSARRSADRGLQALRDGEQAASAEAFEQASSGFASAGDKLSSPLALPILLVPGASQQAAAAKQVAASGEAISSVSVEAATTAPYQDLRAEGGRVDLALIEEMQAPVADVAETLAEAEADLRGVRSSWLLPPVADQLDEVIDEVADTVPDAELAAAALEHVPALFGGAGDRTYLVAFATPAESRFLGGFVGGYGILSAVDGQVDLVDSGRVADLGTIAEPVADLGWSPDLVNRYNRWAPERFLVNGSVTPDFPTDADLMRQLAPGYGLPSVDGVVYVDPIGLAALLELTGPVRVERLAQPVRSRDVADLLLREQYLSYGSNDERSDLLTDVADATFEALTSGDLPGPGKVADALGPAVAGGHLLFETFDGGEQGFLERLGSRGEFPPAYGADLVSLRMSNDGANKLDAYIERDLTYEVELDPDTGLTRSTLVARLRNTAPEGLPDYVVGSFQLADDAQRGDDLLYLSLYSPAQLVDASVDGVRTGIETQVEGELTAYSLLVTVPRGGEVELRFDLEAPLDPAGAYSLTWVPQALAQDDLVRVRVTTPEDGRVVELVEPVAGAEEVGGGVAFEALVAETTVLDTQVARDPG